MTDIVHKAAPQQIPAAHTLAQFVGEQVLEPSWFGYASRFGLAMFCFYWGLASPFATPSKGEE